MQAGAVLSPVQLQLVFNPQIEHLFPVNLHRTYCMSIVNIIFPNQEII